MKTASGENSLVVRLLFLKYEAWFLFPGVNVVNEADLRDLPTLGLSSLKCMGIGHDLRLLLHKTS